MNQPLFLMILSFVLQIAFLMKFVNQYYSDMDTAS